jgi:cation transporter-like permease
MKQTYKIHHRHWHYIYRKRRKALDVSTNQMAGSQILSIVVALIAGVILNSHKESLVLVTGVFVVLPGVLDLDSSIGTALSAKINHILEDPNQDKLHVALSATLFALSLCATAGLIVGTVGGGLTALLFDGSFWRTFAIGWGSMMIAGLVGYPLTALVSVFSRDKNINPDDVIGPSLFDLISIVAIIVVVGLVA